MYFFFFGLNESSLLLGLLNLFFHNIKNTIRTQIYANFYAWYISSIAKNVTYGDTYCKFLIKAVAVSLQIFVAKESMHVKWWKL